MIATLFYMGGLFAAYRIHRKRGQGRFSAGFDAIAWPVGFGYHVCRVFYDPAWGEK